MGILIEIGFGLGSISRSKSLISMFIYDWVGDYWVGDYWVGGYLVGGFGFWIFCFGISNY